MGGVKNRLVSARGDSLESGGGGFDRDAPQRCRFFFVFV